MYFKLNWLNLHFWQAITVFYTLDCYRLFSVFKSLKTERRTQDIVSALFISIDEYCSNLTFYLIAYFNISRVRLTDLKTHNT